MKTSPGDYQEEALDFLRQSLKDYNSAAWKFAVLHASMAVEMLLKERLVKINPGTIIERIDDPNCKTTVGMSRIIPRLESLGIALDKNDHDLIGQIAEWRNDVAHRKLLAKKEDVAKKLAAIYKFFPRFLHDELDTEIKDALGDSEYKEFREHLKEWGDIEVEAQKEAEEAGYVDHETPSRTFDCPQCWGISDTVAYKDEKAHCFLCGEDFDSAKCTSCGQAIIGVSESDEEGPTWCEGCSDNIFNSKD